jgi:hypothetical protein
MIIVESGEVPPKQLTGKRQNSLRGQVFLGLRVGALVGGGA